MDIGSILLILSLLVIVALFVSRPLLEVKPRKKTTDDQENHEVSHLLAERDRIVNALKELDFDFEMGKIPDEIYPSQRSILLQKGADVLRQLDAHASAEPEVVTAEERIEQAIAVRRTRLEPVYSGGNGNSTIEEASDDLEVAIALRRRGRQEKAGGFCPHCGKPVQATDRFCPKCGKPL